MALTASSLQSINISIQNKIRSYQRVQRSHRGTTIRDCVCSPLLFWTQQMFQNLFHNQLEETEEFPVSRSELAVICRQNHEVKMSVVQKMRRRFTGVERCHLTCCFMKQVFLQTDIE